jgi:hypothetical protein
VPAKAKNLLVVLTGISKHHQNRSRQNGTGYYAMCERPKIARTARLLCGKFCRMCGLFNVSYNPLRSIAEPICQQKWMGQILCGAFQLCRKPIPKNETAVSLYR